jgi:ubiquinone/menaquinone biosynthesis C-methylase UbiE
MNDYTKLVAADWAESAYYDSVEGAGARELFWGSASLFNRMFRSLDLSSVLEIACGHGRHYEHYKDVARSVRLLDVNQENIDFCAKRFAALEKKPVLIRNNGRDLDVIADGECSAVFSYDAMVHFEMADVFRYIEEAYRVLRPGGRALFHHSNFTGAPGRRAHEIKQFGWRNYMSVSLFAHVAMRNGFDVVEQNTITWGDMPNLDGVTLLQKPAWSAPEASTND